VEIDSPSSVADLVRDCARGDTRAWEEFVATFSRPITLAVRRTVYGAGSAAESQVPLADLVQEVFVRLVANDYRVLREFRGATEASLISYLARVARSVVVDNARFDLAKKRSATTISLDDTENEASAQVAASLRAPSESAPDRMTEAAASRRAIVEALDRILTGKNAVRDALIFRLFLFEGMSAREIAQVRGLEMTPPNIETVIVRTRARLRKELSPGD
jgi:RNA polymerase sigma factor (sigma-70 family)